jgi:polyferredoxin
MAIALIGDLLKIVVLLGLLLAGIIAIQIWIKNRSRKISYLRIVIQLISQAAIFYLISFPLILSVVLGVVLIATFFIGRFFCGWICPFGFYMDLITLMRKASKVRYWNIPNRFNKYLHDIRYVL